MPLALLLILSAEASLPRIAMKAMDCRPAALCISGGPGQALSPHVARAMSQLGFEVLESDAIDALLSEHGVSRSERDQLCHSDGCVTQLQDALGAFGIDYLMVSQLSVTEKRAELFLTLRRQGSRSNVAKDFTAADQWETLRLQIPKLTGGVVRTLLPENHVLNRLETGSQNETKPAPETKGEARGSQEMAALNRPPVDSVRGLTVATDAEHASIKKVCAVKRVLGKAAYTKCVQGKLTELAKTPRPDFAKVSPQERGVIEGSCKVKSVFGPASFYRCVTKKIDALGAVDRPSYGTANAQERAWIDQTCKARKIFGPASFYTCVAGQVTALQADPRPDYTGLTPQEKAWITHDCRHRRMFGPGLFYRCASGHVNRIRRFRKP
ncbi:MAG: hypothetical protein VX405_11385 [Myxococcota bacterium]|nr:hypothetical protein [Myxococcota bacterium]